MRLDVRRSPAALARPSPALAGLLVVRPVVEAGLDSARGAEVDEVRCLTECRKLLRRLAETLGGRDARRAAGLSSLPLPLPLPLTSGAMDTWRPDAVVRPDAGVFAFG